MVFQSLMGPKNQGVTILSGTTQGNSYPTHYQFNFHTTNEMNLKTHQKLIDFFKKFGFELLINGNLFLGSKCHSPPKLDVDLVLVVILIFLCCCLSSIIART